MKYLITFLSILFSTVLLAQDVVMQNATVNQCGGIFYDSGGEFGPYGNDEDLVITICPENAGQKVQLDFTEFSTQLNNDVMTIYNGDSVAADPFGTFSGAASPGFVQATEENISGCLTIQFVSDGSANTTGWAADISCLTPCQTINSQIDSSTPAPNADDYIRVCPNEDITLNGSGVFSIDGTGATYQWDLGDGNTADGQSVTFSYSNPGVYIVNLNINDTNTSVNPEGCTNNNLINQVIQVATEPDFTGTQATNPTLCYGESTTIEGIVNPVDFINDCTPPISGTTFLPDGSGAQYETCITVDCFDSNQTLTDPNQLVEVCVNMEHSFSGDLDIFVQSPNGQEIRLFDQAGGGTYFGGANDDGTNTPGTGETYCFTMTAATLLANAGTEINGTNPPNDSWIPGSYLPFESFDGLLGSPLNGDWCIRIVDNLSIDNGYIFEWFLNFDPAIQPPELSFTPVITSEAWDPDPTITNTTGNVITVSPPDAGQYSYTYRVTDDFGCEYTREVIVDVLPEIITEIPNDLFVCDTGAPPYLFNLEDNTAVVLASAPNTTDLEVTYHNSQADAEADIGEITANINNYPGTDGEPIFIRVEYLNSGCYEVLPFTLNVSSQPVINAVGDLEVCDDTSNDGFAEFNLDLQTTGILGGQSATAFNVTYHLDFASADAGTGVLPLNYTNTSSPQPIYVRVESVGDSNCYNASANPVFDLVVNPLDNSSFTMDPTCDGATAIITGDAGGTFAFNPVPADGAVLDPNTGLVTGGGSGSTYTIEYTTSGTCPSTTAQTFEVVTVDDPSFTLLATCDGGTASVTGDTGGTFSFDPAPTDGAIIDLVTGEVTGATPGATYTIEYLTSGTCPASSTQDLTVLSLDDPSFTLVPTCDGASANITGDTGGTFALNPVPTDGAVIDTATGTVTGGVSATTYTVEYTTAGDCPQTSSQDFTVLTSDDASFTMDPTCDGGTATVSGTPGGTFGFDVAPTDAAVIDPVTGEMTNGSPNTGYAVSYTTTGTCPVTEVVSFTSLPIDDAGFNVEPTCDGGTVTIIGTPGGTFAFNPLPTDAAVIDVNTGNVTNATPGETYSIEYTTNGTCPNSSIVEFTVNPLPSVVDPDPLEVCDDGTPDGLTEIDLSLKNGEITANDPAYAVSYYLSQADADTATDPLPVPYTNISNPQTVFVRVEDVSTGCFDTTTLELFVEQAPAANEPDPLLYCDPDNDGFGSFTLTDAQDQVTGGAGGLTVTYHETFPNADNGVDAIDTTVPYENITADMQVIYVRIASSTIATNCPTIVELELIVEETPQLVDPDPLEACDDISADGFAQFDLTSKESEILNGQDPVEYIVSFYETEADAEAGTNAIANPTGYTNTVEDAQTVWVRVDDITTANGCYKLTTLDLIVNPLPVLATTPPLELCDVNNPGDGQEAFTLEDANNTILNGQSGITLSYHATLQGAQDGTDEIFSPYTNTENAQTVYVRALNDITGCASTVTLTLRVEPVPTPEPNPTEIRVCDEDNDGFGTFDLESRTLEITNGEPNVVVTYHETQSEAQAGDNALVSPYTNIVANNQTIYVRSESTVTGCYSLTENTLQLLVDPSPEVPTAIADYVVCDDDDDGISQFDLTTKDMEIYNGQDPADFALTYHLSAADATSGNSPITNTTNFTNATNPQTIHVRLVSNANGCVDIGEFEIRVELPPEAIQPTQLSECDDVGERPGDEMTVFDLTLKNTEITGGEASWSVDYYETLADAEAQDNVIADPSQYTNMEVNGQPLNPQTLYAVVTADTGCTDMVTLTIRVQPNPTPTADDLIPDLALCDDMNTGDGVEVFNLLGLGGTNAQEDLILNGENNVTASYYATFEDADAGADAIADPENYTNIESPQEIYVRVANNTTGCYELAQFTIRVNPLPGVVAVTDFVQCELNTDNTASFDLTAKDGEVLNGQDPALFTVSYHASLADAQAQVNALVSPYQNTSSPQQIFVAIRNNDTGCSIATQSFSIEVQEGAAANPDMDPIVYGACDDNMETDGDPTDDSVQFDLGTRDGEVLDGQDPASYQVSYFATQADADLNVNPLPNLYENTTNPQVIYARVDNNTAVVVPIALDLAALGGNGLDLDADGTIDTIDTDGDGVFDLVDVDGDGLSDAIDTNGDGIIEFVDVDGDGQGDPVDLNNDGTFDNRQDGSVCFDVAELTLRVNPLPVFELEDSYVLCVGTDGTEVLDPLVLDTGLSAAEYGFEWSYNGDVLAGETGPDLVPGQGGTYRVVVTDLLTGCVNALDVGLTEVGESGPPSLTVEVLTQAFAENHVIEATATGTGGDFEYSLDGGPWQESGTFTNVSPGEHTVTARDRNGCGTSEGTVTVLDYPLYFTPNGDGNNDTWQIENIGNGAKIYIFDRYGKLLKQISPSGSGWDGTYNGSAMPSSDYWFSVEYEENGQNKQFRAHFTLKR